MTGVLRDTFETGLPLRDAACETLLTLAETDGRIVFLDADCVSSSGLKRFFAKYPERAVQCGISEANMIGIAAGLSAVGYVPFCHSFGTFASRRVVDQVFQSAAYADLNIRIIGSDPGVTAAFNGGTHMPFEDVGSFRSIPGITIIEPTDSVMYAALLKTLAEVHGVYYLRVARKFSKKLYKDGTAFDIGKGIQLTSGNDCTVITSGGLLVSAALEAAEMLKGEGIALRVVDMFTWKPVDAALVARCAEETGAIVVAENHNVIGGLGSAVAEAAAAGRPVPMEFVGAEDRFGQVGTESFLAGEYGMTAEGIVAAVKRAMARRA
ncbi:transketolase family protein [Oscillospiraceae bacterium OttesenSCG-928-F05]|nr:transketolase family protein [Oscillospiraceae bacterium OttesenSCG-928-F05]